MRDFWENTRATLLVGMTLAFAAAVVAAGIALLVVLEPRGATLATTNWFDVAIPAAVTWTAIAFFTTLVAIIEWSASI